MLFIAAIGERQADSFNVGGFVCFVGSLAMVRKLAAAERIIDLANLLAALERKNAGRG